MIIKLETLFGRSQAYACYAISWHGQYYACCYVAGPLL